MSDGLGRGFSRDVEAILSTVQLGAAMGEVFLYPHEVRENLRLAGMRLDRKLELPDFPDPFNLPPDYVPEFDTTQEYVDEETEYEPEEDVND